MSFFFVSGLKHTLNLTVDSLFFTSLADLRRTQVHSSIDVYLIAFKTNA